MRHWYTILLLISCSLHVKGQYNFVTNPSFEIISFCPNSTSPVSTATGWESPPTNNSGLGNTCVGAYVPLPYFSSDYYYQWPHFGDGLALFWAYNGVGNNYRTNLQNTMKDTLTTGKCYCVSFYVNYKNPLDYAINNISLNFSKNQITTTGTGLVLDLAPHVEKFGKPFIGDTLPWVKVEGIYTSTGGEKYLTIGNFMDDEHTDTLRTTYTFNYPGALYFVDDVSVTPIDSIIGGMPAFAGNNTNVTIGDSVFIGQEISNLNCNWYELPNNTQIAANTSGIYVKPITTTTYVVEQNLCGTITNDTVVVSVLPTGLKHYNELQQNIRLYPNPTNGNVTLQIDNKQWQHISITIIDVLGNELYTSALLIKDNLANFNLNVTAGTYFVKVSNNSTNEVVVKKIIKN